jgi:hypothetical protein
MQDSELENPNQKPWIGPPPNAVSQTAEISGDVLARLLTDGASEPGLLIEDRRNISWWPRVAAGRSYSRTGDFSGAGSAGGFLGVRQRKGVLHFRVEYRVTHSLNCKYQSALIVWEGSAPSHGAVRGFLIPFSREDGTARVLLVAFGVDTGTENVKPNLSGVTSRQDDECLLADAQGEIVPVKKG